MATNSKLLFFNYDKRSCKKGNEAPQGKKQRPCGTHWAFGKLYVLIP